MEVKAKVTLEIDAARHAFRLSFSGQLKLIKLGTVGATAGRFVLETGDAINPNPRFWGVATIETNFSALEPYGIFLFAKGTLQINTTDQTQDRDADAARASATAARTSRARSCCGRRASRSSWSASCGCARRARRSTS